MDFVLSAETSSSASIVSYVSSRSVALSVIGVCSISHGQPPGARSRLIVVKSAANASAAAAVSGCAAIAVV